MPSKGNNQGNQGGNKGKSGGNSGERGFAAMPDEKQREIAKKGGETVSKDRKHMSEIGKKGGEASGGGNRGGR